MVTVYLPGIETGPDGNDTHCVLLLVSDADRERLAWEFRGQLIDAAAWVPWLVVRSHTTPGNLRKPLADRAGIDFNTDPMVLSDRALAALLPHMGHAGQALRLAFAETPYSLFAVTRVIDALDLERCEVVRYPDGGISRITKYAFRAETVADEWIFKIPQRPSQSFVTQRFVDLAQAHGLSGFAFHPVWTDDCEDKSVVSQASNAR
jgi:hypothetical protein